MISVGAGARRSASRATCVITTRDVAPLLDLDNNDGSNDTKFTGFTPFVAGTDFTGTQSPTMILRFGYINADNNWWFAVDNVKIEAEVLDFVPGDANDDGFFDFGDIEAFVLALLDPKVYAAEYPNVDPNVVLDFYCDGFFDFGDIEGFVSMADGPPGRHRPNRFEPNVFQPKANFP